MQADPPAVPGIDIGGLAHAIGDAIHNVITDWSNGLPGQVATQGTEQIHGFWRWMNAQGMNFVVHTPLDIVTAAGASFGVNSIRPWLDAVVTVAILIGGVSYAGHRWLGWPGLEETVSRVLITVIATSLCFRLMIFSMTTLNLMVSGVTAELPPLPDIDGGGNAIIAFALLLTWVLLGLRLVVVMGKRLVWLSVLYILGPIAVTTMVHQKSAWIASMWIKLWIGWLVGQLIVVLVLIVGITMARFGGPAGYILSIASLLVAYDAVHILAPSQGGMTVSVGVGPVRLRI